MAGLKRALLMGALAWTQTSTSAIPQQKPLLELRDQSPLLADTGKQLVDSEALQALITSDNLLVRAEKLYEIAKLSEDEYNHPTRVIGSQGHLGTLQYISESLSKLDGYYNYSQQPFTAVTGNVFESQLVLGDTVSQSATPMALTPPTRNKEPVYGRLVLVPHLGCDASNYPAAVSGNIAFIRRGKCPFGTKSELAGKAGAVAAVVYNYEDGQAPGTLGPPSPDHVATFGLSGLEANPLVEALRQGEAIPASAFIDARIDEITTHNIIAQTVGGDPDNCVMLGGHSDSVAEGPGINDDGSGSLSLLEVATQLARFRVRNCVRFAWFSAEEEGLLGSDNYVATLPAAEKRRIRLFMDYDMMGSPNFAYQIYNATDAANPAGSEHLRDLYAAWYRAHGLNYTLIPFDGRSDYDGFIRHGIPGGGVATGAEGLKTEAEAAAFGGPAGEAYDGCYHQLCDDVANVNLTAWETNTRLIAHSVATFALSFDGFPEREEERADRVEASVAPGGRYHGHRLVV